MTDKILEKYGIPEEEMEIFSDIRKLLAKGEVIGSYLLPDAVGIQFDNKTDQQLFGFACATIKNNIKKRQQEEVKENVE